MQSPRIPVLIATIVAAAALRLVPHLPNFTPIAALALFGGAQFANKRLAFGVPLVALFLSDLVLGFYPGMAAVYGTFAVIVCLGFALRSRRSAFRIGVAVLAGSVWFFASTNFAVWATGSWYPPTSAGLAMCYTAGIPFFRYELLGDAFYATVLFGGFALVERRWPQLAESAVSVS